MRKLEGFKRLELGCTKGNKRKMREGELGNQKKKGTCTGKCL